jgi:hypothetical protein
MASPPKKLLCFSRAITYVIVQRNFWGRGAIANGTTDAKNASVDGPLGPNLHFFFSKVFFAEKLFIYTSILLEKELEKHFKV